MATNWADLGGLFGSWHAVFVTVRLTAPPSADAVAIGRRLPRRGDCGMTDLASGYAERAKSDFFAVKITVVTFNRHSIESAIEPSVPQSGDCNPLRGAVTCSLHL
ncbi:hypothetical protein EJ06DRAFT_534260 [Trichodelitschia bisporula]|uniref:Uncharacterized protein n=1 Tax=Trichodelitschia bisporula TaxID=703511 RepID=A0A6G1HJU0_9PEZI|nr:hypothetical protein EJ06DRAFT_534260 [Trichodelitschia bisporula]